MKGVIQKAEEIVIKGSGKIFCSVVQQPTLETHEKPPPVPGKTPMVRWMRFISGVGTGGALTLYRWRLYRMWTKVKPDGIYRLW